MKQTFACDYGAAEPSDAQSRGEVNITNKSNNDGDEEDDDRHPNGSILYLLYALHAQRTTLHSKLLVTNLHLGSLFFCRYLNLCVYFNSVKSRPRGLQGLLKMCDQSM